MLGSTTHDWLSALATNSYWGILIQTTRAGIASGWTKNWHMKGGSSEGPHCSQLDLNWAGLRIGT
eukprot:9107153-Alexandrium_andersonii.AAC.1